MTAFSLLVASIIPAAADSVQVLEFTSTQCPACVRIEPVVKRLIGDGFPIVRVDPSREMALTQKFGVTAMPTFIVLVRGKVFNQHTGMIPESELRQMILAARDSIRPKDSRQKRTSSNVSSAKSTNAPQKFELIDFHADYCQACVSMNPIIARLEKSGVPIRRVNISEQWKLTRQLKIGVLPTFVMLANGKEVGRHAGIATESQLRKLIDKARPTGSSDSLAESGRKAPRFPNPMTLLGLDRRTGDRNNSTTNEPVVRAKLDQRDENGVVIHRTGPMPASVRVRVRVTGGKQINLGSGTVIESRPGRSLVLTCAHIVLSLIHI